MEYGTAEWYALDELRSHVADALDGRCDEQVVLDGVTFGGSSYAWNETLIQADENLCRRLLQALTGEQERQALVNVIEQRIAQLRRREFIWDYMRKLAVVDRGHVWFGWTTSETR